MFIQVIRGFIRVLLLDPSGISMPRNLSNTNRKKGSVQWRKGIYVKGVTIYMNLHTNVANFVL
jgi:hypothetical protein